MATNAGIPARSIYGCWTCRVRKKKCDETRPICRNCNSLGLNCHGYGPKPEWMDGGILQKEQSLKYKTIVGKAKAKRERQLLAHEIYSSQNLHTELDLLQAEKPGLLDTLSVPVYQHNALSENVAVQAHSEGLIDEADEMFLCPFNQFPLQSLTQPMANLNAMTPPFSQNMETGGNLLSTASSERVPRMSNDSPGLLDAQWTSMIAVDTALATNGPTASTAGEFMSVTPRNSSEVHAYPSYEFATLAHVLTEDVCPPRPSPPNEPILGQEAEDTLFMHYFDQVFYLQFPFYHSQGTLQRGWLFSILRRVKPAYYATLALSERHLIATGVSPMSSETRYYDLALQGMQLIIKEAHTLTGHVRILRCLDGLTCILQLLFWTLLAGGTEDWQVLLNAAAGLIPVLVQERMRLIMSESTDPEPEGNQAQRGTRCHEDDCGISVLLGSFLSIDIISCASTRSAPFFHVDHVQALRDLGIPLEYITGCKRSVMVLISEISSLDRWKKEFEACHKLSIVDLVKRGGQIEERLRQELVELGNMQTTGSSLRNPSAIRLTPIYPQVGQLFTLSAIIYLHVAISGAHPELPEIAEAVSKTIPLFKSLKEPGLLYSVIWPFCISGCLALEEHQGFFRELYSASGITNSAFGTCCEAFKMMEKCWHARKIGSHNFDWVSIMNQNGNFVLLR